MEKVENKELCSECGYCCLKSGCDYFVCDVPNNTIQDIESMLDTGRVSIIATLRFTQLPKGNMAITPILSLRARNQGRGEIDLLSMKTKCASLQDGGCFYTLEERPSGGAALIPKKNRKCKSSVDKLEELQKWLPYQKNLERIVKRRTGKGVYSKLKEDVENLFYAIYISDFDGVMPEELEDIHGMLPYLCEIYPEELNKASKRANAKNPIRALAIKPTKKRAN